VSEANRQRRVQNREARTIAAEEHLRRTKQRRIVIASVGLLLAVVVGLALVAAAVNDDDGGGSASGSTTTTGVRSVAGKPCVARSDALPVGAPDVAVKVGPPPTKLVKVDIKKGTGPVVKADDTVTVDYIGVACSTGKIFDSTYQRNESYTTPLSEVVPGWQQGIPGMRVGGSRLLGVPPALGYADDGSGELVPPGETLWFVVKVDKIDPAATATSTP
jgi:peptidylprolyl isomerase